MEAYPNTVRLLFHDDLQTADGKSEVEIENTEDLCSNSAFGNLEFVFDRSIRVGGGICFRGIFVHEFRYEEDTAVSINYDLRVLNVWVKQLVKAGRLPESHNGANLAMYHHCCT